jgi:CYTH domain-containing protein
MPLEIERKFLVKNEAWRGQVAGLKYRQGYLFTAENKTVRVRTVGDKGFLTIKGKTAGATRAEYEYEIPFEHANEILDNLCIKPLIDKVRYKIRYKGLTWEVDEFFGENRGLILAEVELTDENQVIDLPDWVGEEVTADPRYYNANLAANSYSTW